MDLYDEVNAFLECEINCKSRKHFHTQINYCILILDTHISIGGIVIETFEPAVQALIHSSLVLATRE